MTNRELEEDDYDVQSYLVDSKGNAYEAYSVAWRYLGMYIDCDLPDPAHADSSSSAYENVNRHLASGDQEANECSRIVLWAAYHDPGYSGGSIGEYQFYDWKKGVWDQSTCKTKRCARMDCHEPSTQFQLIGVFKETDGLVDWAEQLFKHAGYCLWNDLEEEEDEEEQGSDSGDKDDGSGIYDFMDGFRQYWPSECKKLYLTDYDGNTLYLETKPQSQGNMTYGLYLDEDCSEEATMKYPQYVHQYVTTYYGYDEQEGLKAAAYWSNKFTEWNQWMTSYKVCNPCRAYSRVPTTTDKNDNKNRLRGLNEGNDEEDGQGNEEQWGFNCYDNAGYTNCNQCYKFETKTNLEPASVEDLERASVQGSILAIKLDGKVYGEGYISNTPSSAQSAGRFFVVIGSFVLIGIAVYLNRSWLLKLLSGRRKDIEALQSSFGEAIFKTNDQETVKTEDSEVDTYTQQEFDDKQAEVENLKHQLSQERVQSQLERLRKDEYIKQLEKIIESKEVLKEALHEASLSYSLS